MRILVVQESDWIARGPHQSHHLMERLSKRGHVITVIDYEILWRRQGKRGLISKRQVFKNIHKAIKDGAVTVIRPPFIKVPALDYLSLIYTHRNEIQRQIAEFNPDVIIGFGILNANIAINMAKKNGIPFVYYIIDELHRLVPEKAFQILARFIESYDMKNADLILSINEGLQEYTIQMGAPKDRTRVIRAGVDLECFSSANGGEVRERYGIHDDEIVLFFMGWLYEFSGLREVATELARYEDERFKLLVLGKGDIWDDLQHIKHAYGLDGRLITVDWCPYSDVPKYIAASDICLLPAYKNEIMRNIVPIKIYEYMAAGKPVIATKLPGLVKEFGFNHGIVYADGPNDVLYKAIELIENNRLPEKCKEARLFIERNDWEKITGDFERTLKKIIEVGIKQ